jgi:hypothetical protein
LISAECAVPVSITANAAPKRYPLRRIARLRC